MKKIMPVILMALGIMEIIIAVMDIKMPIIITFAVGFLFIVWGIKILIDARKEK